MLDLISPSAEVKDLAPRVVSIMDVAGGNQTSPVTASGVAFCLDDGMVLGLDDDRLALVASGAVDHSPALDELLGRPCDSASAELLVSLCFELVRAARPAGGSPSSATIALPVRKTLPAAPPSIADLEAEMERAITLQESRSGRRLA